MNEMTPTPAPTRQFLKDYVAPTFDVESIYLKFELDPTQTIVTSTLKLKRKVSALIPKALRLDGVGLKLISIQMNQQPLHKDRFSVDENGLTLLNPPDAFELQTVVEINPSQNTACEGLYLSDGIFCTQCEAESFRKITYMLDRPDAMTTYTVEITADKKLCPVLLSNGDLIESGPVDEKRHKAIWQDPHKKPSYLFALVAGDLGSIHDTFKTKSGKVVKLSVYATHGKQSRCHHAMESLKRAMKWDEERFGLEYDLGQYMIASIDDFNMGAMENKGLNVFNSRLVLADQESATDSDFDNIEAVVGHEYFHNWTGNRVTCRNWFELSLKEGLTVFRDQEFSADLHSRSVQRIKDVDALRAKQFSEDASPNAHPVRPESCLAVDNFYTATIYEKGAELIRMLQTFVGRAGFRKGMDEYFKRHDGQAVTIIDFVKAICEPNQFEYSQFLLWYSQEGTPAIEVISEYNEKQKQFHIHLTQTPAKSHQQPFHIPLKFGFIDPLGQEIKVESNLIQLKDSKQTFTFSNIQTRPVLSLNREFSAPVRIVTAPVTDELLHLMKYDSDDFNRREAAVKLFTAEAVNLVSQFKKNPNAQINLNTSIVSAVETVLKDQKISPQFKALMLQIPSEQSLAQELTEFTSAAVFKARQNLYQGLVQAHTQLILDLYHQHGMKNSSGDRALKNVLLGYLSAARNQNFESLLERQYFESKNMTDRLAALMFACDHETPLRDQLLNAFKDSWIQDKVVINKWLQVQAISTAPDTFERVCKLADNPIFDLKNPNNVYSLVGGFGSNLIQFHQERMDVYNWYLQRLTEVDHFNPQAAARISAAFQLLPKLPIATQNNLRQLIQSTLKVEKLSKNTIEQLERL